MKYVKIFDTYIAMMLATVALATLLPARNRGAEVVGLAADVGIVVLFFLYGTRLSPRTALGGLMKWKLHLAVLLTTFALFPALGVGLSYLARDLTNSSDDRCGITVPDALYGTVFNRVYLYRTRECRGRAVCGVGLEHYRRVL